MTLEIIRFALSAVLTVLGLFALVSGVLGVFRFRYALTRIHAAALFDVIGILLIGIGVMIALGFTVATLKMIFIIAMLWLTSPVSSHLIGRLEITINDELDSNMDIVDPETVEREKEGV